MEVASAAGEICAFDGKQMPIRSPIRHGSQFSIVVLALVVVNYRYQCLAVTGSMSWFNSQTIQKSCFSTTVYSDDQILDLGYITGS